MVSKPAGHIFGCGRPSHLTKGKSMNTEITLPAAELKQALPGLSKVISKKTTLPVLQTLKVSRERNGQVTLQATDLDSFVAYTFNDKNCRQPIELLVPFEQLNKALKCSGSKDDVALICEDKDVKLRYYIAGSPVHQPIPSVAVDEWPPIPKIDGQDHKLEAGFGVALRQALESCGDDPSRHVLHGAFLDVTDKSAHYIVGTNGRALFSANSFTFPFKKSVIIPDSKFLAGSDFLDEETCYLSIDPGKGKSPTQYVRFKSAKWTLITKEIEGNFPNWKQAIPTPTGKWTHIKLNPPAVSQLLQVIPKLPGDDSENHPVRLRIEKCIWAEGRNKDDKDWAKIAVSDVVVTSKPLNLCLNRNYLMQALKFGLDEFAVEDELSPVVFTKAGKRFAIMPVRPVSATSTPPPQPTASKPAPPTTNTTERKTMPRVAKTPVPSAPTAENNGSTVKELLGQVELIKENLKKVFGDLTTVTGKLKAVDKEKRTTQKEVDGIRKQLRRIQTVTI